MTTEENIIPPPLEDARTASEENSSLWFSLIGALAVLLTGVVFYFVDPVQHSIFPRCFFHQLTGLHCPGCGGQRALHHLVHGEILTALRCNALLFAVTTLAAWMLARAFVKQFAGRALPSPFEHPRLCWALAGLVVLFGVLRNLPGFAWLAP